jgi:RNA polymerase sigma factor (sigma-70 family)
MDEKRAQFDAEVLPHLDAAYRFAKWLSRSASDAEDVVQEAILRAFRGFGSHRGGDAKAWLLAIVRNCHLTAAARQHRRAQVPLPDEHDANDGHVLVAADDPESESIRDDQALALERLLSALPDEYREVLVLREIEDMAYREIAAVTSVPIGTVMSRLARARAALKTQWLREEEGDIHVMR